MSAQLFSNSLVEAGNAEEEDQVEILGCINLNGDALYEGGSMPLPWSSDNCKVLVNAITGEDFIKSIEVHDLDCHPKTANELLEFLITQKLPREGLNSLILEWFKPTITEL